MVVTVSSPVTILNVDDHEISRYSRSRLLRQAGYEVKEAATGYEALHLLRQERPALVLLDVRLPDISGLEVCRSIKSDPVLASTMVLQISASQISSQERVRGLEGGADSYLTEPVEPDELIAQVKALLRLAEAEQKLARLNETLEERVRDRTDLLQLLHEIATVTHEVETVEEALQFALDRICAYTGWPVGHSYWLHREKPDELVSSGLWHLDDPERFATFRQASESARFPLGVGLPGQVLASGELTWVIDVSQLHARRAEAAAQSGLQVGFGFPLWADQEIVAVLEFFTAKAAEPEGSFLEGMTQIGIQLGRVVERRRAEQRLRESEEELRRLNAELEQRVAERTAQLTAATLELRQANERFALAEAAAGGFHYEWDVDTDTVVRSEGFSRVLGYEPGEVPNTLAAWAALIHPDDFKSSSGELHQFLKDLKGDTFGAEVRVRHKQGHYLWLSDRSLVVRDEGGRVRRVIGQTVDISERKRAEAALREQQATLQSFYDSAPFLMGIAELDSDRTVAVSSNRAMADFFGMRPEDLPGKTGIALGNPAEFERLLVENYRRSQREGAPVHFDYEYPHPAGPLWLSLTAAFISIGLNGNPRFSFVVEDVTPRKRTEEALHQSEERFRLAIEHSPIIPAACDRELRYLWIYNADPHFIGRQIISKRDDELAPAEDVAELIALKQAVLANGSASRQETRIRVVSQDRFYDISAKPLYDVKGLIYGVTTIATDITERKLVEEALRESNYRFQIASAAARIGIHDYDIVNNRIQWDHQIRALWGVGPDETVTYETFSAGLHPGDLARVQAAVEQALDPSGDGTFYAEYRVIHREDRLTRWVAATGRAFFVQGKAVRFIGTALDITARKRAEEGQQLLAETSRLLTTSLDAAARLEAAAELLVEDFADWCVLNSVSEDGTIHLSVAEHHQPEKTALIYEFVQSYPLDATAEVAGGTIEALRTEQPKLYPAFLEGVPPERAQDPLHRQFLDKLGDGSTIVAPLVARGPIFGSITLVRAGLKPPFDAVDLALAEEVSYRMAIALDNSYLYQSERAARLEAEAAQKSLAYLAEMRERNRLAQELHDTVAQALGYLNLKISIAHSALANHQVEAATAQLHELKGVINETYTDVREEIFYLRAKALSDLSFLELLQRYVEKYRRFYNLEIHLIQEADLARFDFSPEVTAQLVRTVQEALINVRKHARVNRATIRLGQSGDALRISIEDTGQGFDLAQNGSKSSSYGLQIMRERMESIGGRLEIATAPGQGTRIILHYGTGNQDSS